VRFPIVFTINLVRFPIVLKTKKVRFPIFFTINLVRFPIV
jgi:hypothetical protein